MDVLQSTLKLYEWFGLNSSFCLEEDFIKIITVTDTPERDRASILCALDNLEKYELIQSKEVNFKKDKRKVWILEKPLESMPQKIEINYTLAMMIAEVINACAERFDVKESVCDVSNITENNVRDLVLLASAHMPSEESVDNNL